MSTVAQKLVELTGEQARRHVEATMMGAPTLNPYLREMVKLAPRSQATGQPYDWQAARRDAGDVPGQVSGGPSSPATAARQRELVYSIYTSLGRPEPGLRGASPPSAETETAKTLLSLKEGNVAAAPEAQSMAQILVQMRETPAAEPDWPGEEETHMEESPVRSLPHIAAKTHRPSAKAAQATSTTTKSVRKWTTEEFIHLLRTICNNIEANWGERIRIFNQTYELPAAEKARDDRTRNAVMQKLTGELGTWGVEGLKARAERKLRELGVGEEASAAPGPATVGMGDEMEIDVIDLTMVD